MGYGVVGTAGGTTDFDVAAFNEIFVRGTITGSYFDPACTVPDTAGTFTGSRIDATLANVKGTLTGSVANLTTVGLKGTLSGGVVKGTVDASNFIGSTVKTSGMLLYNSGLTALTGATPGTFTHGLGGIPNVVLVTPVAGFGTGVVGAFPKVNAIGSVWFTVAAGTTGTVIAYAFI